jgi:hypothetical protein
LSSAERPLLHGLQPAGAVARHRKNRVREKMQRQPALAQGKPD